MTQAPLQPASQDQLIRYPGLTWEQFKQIQEGFDHAPGIRLSYYRGTIEMDGNTSCLGVSLVAR
jgi:hypothetical protein